jgi:uncharacterized membrane protein YuzA (DUF378 family)
MERRPLIARIGSCFALLFFLVAALVGTAAGWLKVVMVLGGLVSVVCAFASRPVTKSSA